MTIVATGTHRKDDSAATYIKGEVGKILDKSEEACKTASKGAIVGIVPTVLTGTASILRFFKAPEFICKGLEALGGSSCDGCAETTAGHCAKATNSCAKATLNACIDSTSKSKDGFFRWAVSWFKS